eukprot:SAG31_NODE_22627_length_521_cov_1.286730_1_plen_104_part_00
MEVATAQTLVLLLIGSVVSASDGNRHLRSIVRQCSCVTTTAQSFKYMRCRVVYKLSSVLGGVAGLPPQKVLSQTPNGDKLATCGYSRFVEERVMPKNVRRFIL